MSWEGHAKNRASRQNLVKQGVCKKTQVQERQHHPPTSCKSVFSLLDTMVQVKHYTVFDVPIFDIIGEIS